MNKNRLLVVVGMPIILFLTGSSILSGCSRTSTSVAPTSAASQVSRPATVTLAAAIATPSSSPGRFRINLVTNPDPPLMGSNKLQIQVSNGSVALNDANVSVDFSMPSMKMDQYELEAIPQGDGRYLADVTFRMRGEWLIRVTTRSGGEQQTGEFKVVVK